MKIIHFARRYQNPLIFVGGFLFDCLTVTRIDSWMDILLELLYIFGLTVLILFQYRENAGVWTPGRFLSRVWHFNVEALHFIYGGLLSVNTVLYFKSSTGAKPIVFFGLLVALLFLNEFPQIRRTGFRLRLGLYAFCLSSFLIYFVPMLIGFMGDWVFLLSIGVTVGLVWLVAGTLVPHDELKKKSQLHLFKPAAAVLGLITVLYYLRLIPPVPLSVQMQGIYHTLQKTETGYSLLTLERPFYLFWKKDSRPFNYREGDVMYYFVRIFAPKRFKHRTNIRWELRADGAPTYITTDLIPMTVIGGRGEGFRGYGSKARYSPGKWRVSIETEDGRTIGATTFHATPDPTTAERRWKEIKM